MAATSLKVALMMSSPQQSPDGSSPMGMHPHHARHTQDDGSLEALAAVQQIEEQQQQQAAYEAGKPIPGSEEWLRQRRESHKEVERRRREHINAGINELAKLIPNCSERNKGDILHKAVTYISSLKETEGRNAERWTLDKMLADQAINDLSAYIEYLKAENEQLRSTIANLGGEAPARLQPPPPPTAAAYPTHAAAAAMTLHPHLAHYFAPHFGGWGAAAAGAGSNAPTASNGGQVEKEKDNERDDSANEANGLADESGEGELGGDSEGHDGGRSSPSRSGNKRKPTEPGSAGKKKTRRE